MSVIVAINQVDMLVMLEDERVLPITGLYASPGPEMLTSESKLTEDLKVDEWEIAEVFTVGFPDEPNIHLIVQVGSLTVAQKAN